MRTIALSLLLAIGLLVPAASAESAIPSRLDKAKAGEWVVMRDISVGGEEEIMRISVSAVREGNPKVVVLKRERLAPDGSVEESKEMELDLDSYAERVRGLEDKAKQISRERLTVKDKELTVYAVSWDDERDDVVREFKIWVSEDLPIGGIAKFWCSDPEMPSAEVVDYGF